MKYFNNRRRRRAKKNRADAHLKKLLELSRWIAKSSYSKSIDSILAAVAAASKALQKTGIDSIREDIAFQAAVAQSSQTPPADLSHLHAEIPEEFKLRDFELLKELRSISTLMPRLRCQSNPLAEVRVLDIGNGSQTFSCIVVIYLDSNKQPNLGRLWAIGNNDAELIPESAAKAMLLN